MNEMIIRVAEALHKAEDNSPFDNCPYCINLARIAIEAMRSATDHQQNNYFKMAKAEGYNDLEACFSNGTWKRMIDAALRED